MRTTLDIDEAVGKRLRAYATAHSLQLKEAVNELLRKGLSESSRRSRAKPYRTKPKDVGLQPGLSYDNVAELLEAAEGPLRR